MRIDGTAKYIIHAKAVRNDREELTDGNSEEECKQDGNKWELRRQKNKIEENGQQDWREWHERKEYAKMVQRQGKNW